MKTLKILIASIFVLAFISCDKEDAAFNNTYDKVNGQTGIGFTIASTGVSVPVTGASVAVPVQVTTVSTTARTFTVTVNDALSTGVAGDYTIGSITIPADSFEGTLDVSFVDTFLVDLVSYDLVLDINTDGGEAIVGEETVTIQYNKTVVCNDYELAILLDNWGSETTWDITDDMGATVQSGGPYGDGIAGTVINASFTLADGCYTFTINDAYADGLFDGTNTGTYDLTCSILTAASGSGNFGAVATHDFCVNP